MTLVPCSYRTTKIGRVTYTWEGRISSGIATFPPHGGGASASPEFLGPPTYEATIIRFGLELPNSACGEEHVSWDQPRA